VRHRIRRESIVIVNEIEVTVNVSQIVAGSGRRVRLGYQPRFKGKAVVTIDGLGITQQEKEGLKAMTERAEPLTTERAICDFSFKD
jgi:hypothetical protein